MHFSIRFLFESLDEISVTTHLRLDGINKRPLFL